MNPKATIDQMYAQMAKQTESASAAAVVRYHIPPDRQPEMAELSMSVTAILSDLLSWEKVKPVYQKIDADALGKSTEAMQSRMPEVMSAIQKATEDFVQERHLQKP